MSKTNLTTRVQETLAEHGIELNAKQAKLVTDSVLESVLFAVKENEIVRTPIGTFRYVLKPERKAINPRTQQRLVVPAFRTVLFRAASKVKSVVQQPTNA